MLSWSSFRIGIAEATLTPDGAIEYHNGGIVNDDQQIWGTIAQYRPNSIAHVTCRTPSSLQPTTILNTTKDYEGNIVHDVPTNTITALTWGSCNASEFDLRHLTAKARQPMISTRPQSFTRNPSYFIDYQDCKSLGHSHFYDYRPIMLCSGVATIANFNLSGIALVDIGTTLPLVEVPIAMTSSTDVPGTQNL